MAFNNTNTTNSGLTGNTHGVHDRREDGGVVDALNPAKGSQGSHLPHSGAQHASTIPGQEHNQYNTTHSSNPLSSTTGHSTHTQGSHVPGVAGVSYGHNNEFNNTSTHSSNPLSSNTNTGHSSNPLSSNTHSSTHPTGTHASSGLTGGSHATHNDKREDGGVTDALNPSKGTGTHLPTSNQHGSSHPTNAHGAAGNSNLVGQGREPTSNPIGGAHNIATGTTTSHAGSHAHQAPGAHNTTGSALGGHEHQHATPGSHSATGSHNTTSTTGAHNTTATGAHTQEKVPVGDKIKGTVESLVGKATKNPEKVAHGEALKTGDLTHGAAAGVHQAGANHTSTH